MTVDENPSADDHGKGGMPRDSSAPALPLLVAGLLAGVCLALAAGCGILLAARSVSPDTPATVTPLISTRTARATSTPVGGVPTILLDAEALWRDGDPQAVIELLSPSLNSLTRDDRARAYELLGQAELQLGHSSLAGACFERAYELEPTVERLYGAALGYDLGGDEDRALARYLELVAWEGEKADAYREFATGRIEHLGEILGTPPPTP